MPPPSPRSGPLETALLDDAVLGVCSGAQQARLAELRQDAARLCDDALVAYARHLALATPAHTHLETVLSICATEVSQTRGVRALAAFLLALPHHVDADAYVPRAHGAERDAAAATSTGVSQAIRGTFSWADGAIALAESGPQPGQDGGVNQPRLEFAVAAAHLVCDAAIATHPGAPGPRAVLLTIAAAVRNAVALAVTLSHERLNIAAAALAAGGPTPGAACAGPLASFGGSTWGGATETSWFVSEADAAVGAGLPLPLGFSASRLQQQHLGLAHYLRVTALELPALCGSILEQVRGGPSADALAPG